MHSHSMDRWTHSHSFGQDRPASGERRTLLVVALTAITMVVEVAAGLWTGSMALLADGVHMASHTLALGIAAFAYVYARRHAHDDRFSFGTGKVNALGGFTGALLLAVVALGMGWESVSRLFSPGAIAFEEAIVVAVLGLVVNAASVLILGGHGHDHHDHDHHGHDHAHDHDHDHDHLHRHEGHAAGHEDHNLRSAYLHVLADALTSVLAIVALLGAKYLGAGWLDPAMGIVGALLVANWSRGLMASTSRVLLDHQAPDAVRARLRAEFEHDGDRLADLHVWSVGPGVSAAILSIVTHAPQSPEHYRARIPAELGIRHASIEVNRCG
ncbi:CDF family Co(II)/Ni(II) efflux transporter DmeF [Rhodospirillum centenum]|uniref:Cation diffusion facilitator family transporter, putative n=1 Tax=Rhodospirillum centenum (strain ATCC 51521 / SW) TaxID=414684 RepID=B6IY10_RHOCS|nr:CDF family Co(II)/Ni(II) efflux transporter DmeF [Rhodospirillum centenum]ACJ01184.1 cation diffusion facilitator family transporter, putative [Rhodospirillum centenum SW]